MDCTAPVMRSYVNHFKQAIGSFFFDFRYVFGSRLDRVCPTRSGAMRHKFFQRSKLRNKKKFHVPTQKHEKKIGFHHKNPSKFDKFSSPRRVFCFNSTVSCDEGSLAYHLRPALRLVSDFWQEKWSQNWTKVPAV